MVKFEKSDLDMKNVMIILGDWTGRKEDDTMDNLIVLPEGFFCGNGNCSDCLYANYYDRDQYGRVKCEGNYGGYNRPEDRNGCFHYECKN